MTDELDVFRGVLFNMQTADDYKSAYVRLRSGEILPSLREVAEATTATWESVVREKWGEQVVASWKEAAERAIQQRQMP